MNLCFGFLLLVVVGRTIGVLLVRVFLFEYGEQ